MYYDNKDELIHYGVKGMKWGVRRDVELLANHRRNVTVKRAKEDYKTGKITSSKKKEIIQKANADKKNYLQKTKRDYESLTSKSAREKASANIAKQAYKEVPNRTLKKGLRVVNNILTGVNIGAQGVSSAAAIAMLPAAAPLILASTAGYTAGQVGARYVRKMLGDAIA